jgi:hypothetical protein
MEDNLNFYEVEDDQKFLDNGRRPQKNSNDLEYLSKWKTTSYCFENGSQPHFLLIGRRPQFFILNGRQPQFFSSRWKTTSNVLKMKDNLKYFENGRRPKKIQNERLPQSF